MPDCGSGTTVDRTPPLTTIHGLEWGWHADAGPVTLSLSAFEASSSPVVTYYRIGGGPVITYMAPFDVSAEGTTTVRFWSQDSAETPNTELEQTRYVRIDRGAPTLTTVPLAEYRGPAVVRFGLSDAHSGVGFAAWRLNGAQLSGVAPTGGSVTVSAPGAHVLSWTALDNAGNESTGAASFTVKRTQTLVRTPARSALTLRRVRGVVTYRAAVTVRATPETAPFTGSVPLAGKQVVLQRSTDGRTWKTVATRTTSAAGTASYSVRITKAGKARYRWYSPSSVSAAAGASPITTVTVR
ncbi:MAG: hypothetical protein U1E26_01780 [Coriobacteriia bacterium]|nr:hypothetical protein [Coriobacteriia bacterium]